ncbi:MAG TPA: hypothetical protein VMS96_12525 [Terriglobales bacterium]|nr:hypothetical protein [Terriglobales bacterium]
MKRKLTVTAAALVTLALLTAGMMICAATPRPAEDDAWSDPAITIYNQNFAVVRQALSLDLTAGVNTVRFTETTGFLEPDSVMLRDPLGRRNLQVLEQNFRNDPVSQELLLSMYEGKTIDFLIKRDGEKTQVIKGKIIRSGYTPRYIQPQYGYGYQQPYAQGSTPIIEIDGHLQFGLPGQPLFPALGNDTVLKPTLHWLLATDKPGHLDAELSYVSGGMRWEADYNVVAPETGEVLDVIGWITIDNQSGKQFDHARVRLMAGDVNKIMPGGVLAGRMAQEVAAKAADAMAPPVTERAFDEYHLYSLVRPVTLRDHETKQVEFVRAGGVQSKKLFVYDGAAIDWNRYSGWSFENIRNDPSYGTQSNPKIWVMQEFKNTAENHMGIALPRGRMRFYRRDEQGRLQFTGENYIDHTPKDETIRLYTGNSFDLVGERKRTDYKVDVNRQFCDESFEIKVRNHKKESVEVRVVEHLYRWSNWEITSKTHGYRKIDSNRIEFPVTVKPDGEVTVRYTVHYSW